MNLHVVTALFIYLLPHIVYPKALEYGILAFRRIERSEVEGQNSEMFQKCCSSDLPLSIPLNTRTLVYNKSCSPQASTNYATNYFPLSAAQVRTIDEIIPLCRVYARDAYRSSDYTMRKSEVTHYQFLSEREVKYPIAVIHGPISVGHMAILCS